MYILILMIHVASYGGVGSMAIEFDDAVSCRAAISTITQAANFKPNVAVCVPKKFPATKE